MPINFTKYQGTGNDFVIIDNRDGSHNTLDVKKLCDRKFGVGADGLMLLENEEGYDFKMVYYNSDGAISSMCGNGGRCLVHFAKSLGIFNTKCKFIAIDGEHLGEVNDGIVSLKMNDLSKLDKRGKETVLDTGSPHFIKFVDQMPQENFVSLASAIRNSEEFKKEGINVNFIQVDGNKIAIRTFERGVEDETLSCGTGVTAAAIAAHAQAESKSGDFSYHLITQGGELKVTFEYENGLYKNVWLIGSANKVFTGTI